MSPPAAAAAAATAAAVAAGSLPPPPRSSQSGAAAPERREEEEAAGGGRLTAAREVPADLSSRARAAGPLGPRPGAPPRPSSETAALLRPTESDCRPCAEAAAARGDAADCDVGGGGLTTNNDDDDAAAISAAPPSSRSSGCAPKSAAPESKSPPLPVMSACEGGIYGSRRGEGRHVRIKDGGNRKKSIASTWQGCKALLSPNRKKPIPAARFPANCDAGGDGARSCTRERRREGGNLPGGRAQSGEEGFKCGKSFFFFFFRSSQPKKNSRKKKKKKRRLPR